MRTSNSQMQTILKLVYGLLFQNRSLCMAFHLITEVYSAIWWKGRKNNYNAIFQPLKNNEIMYKLVPSCAFLYIKNRAEEKS